MGPVKVLAIVLAGGEGNRLRPLTTEYPKPALPFANGCRIIDFVLSNLVNSRVSSIYVLAQYKPQSLIDHIDKVWKAPRQSRDYSVETVAPRSENDRYLGTAHAVYRNLDLIERHGPDFVAVFAADHVYRMDIRQMVNFHVRCEAEMSVAAVPVPIEKARAFGVIVSDRNGRINEFQEKPERPVPLPTDPRRAYASMGNYLFSTRCLLDILWRADCAIENDFGKHVLPQTARNRRAFAYDFTANHVPGVHSYEERAYWRDVGTLDAYAEARLDVLGPTPRFDLCNPHWPIRGATIEPPKSTRRTSADGQLRSESSSSVLPHSEAY